jgi:cell wall assembly regulator SMI1
MHPMQAIWDRIEARLNIHAPEVLDTLLTGVDDDDIQEIEAELGYQLPEDVRASLRLHNGTIDGFADIWRLLTIDEIAGEQKRLSLGYSMKRPYWIPLASDGCGDFLCVDVEQGEQLGQIIHFDHETVSSWVAPSFQVLLAMFADHLEMGKYALDETGRLHSQELLFSRDQLGPGMEPKYY